VVKAVAFKEVQSILKARCTKCHGDSLNPKDGIDLRTLASIRKGNEASNPVVIPGNPVKSPLFDSIAAERMPPAGNPRPSEKDLQLIRDWIASGAKERRTIRRRGAVRKRPFQGGIDPGPLAG
jgi:uncharacterized membrane protein